MDKQGLQSIQNPMCVDQVYSGLDYDNSVSVLHGPDGAEIVVLEEDFQNGLKAIHKFVDRVVDTPGPAFRLRVTKGRLMPMRTRLSNIPTGSFISRSFRDTYELSEQVRIFLEAEDELQLREEFATEAFQVECWRRPNGISVESANNLVELIRHKAMNKDFRRRLAVRRFAAKSNFDRGAKLIDALFAANARLNVVRIDLDYRAQHRPSLPQIKADFARFLNNRRHNSLFDSTLAVIWRLECGIRTGYHIHLILLLDGEGTRNDGYVAQQFCEYWAGDITRGRGRFQNCNYDKNKYKRLGIGMIHRSETEKGGKRDVLV